MAQLTDRVARLERFTWSPARGDDPADYRAKIAAGDRRRDTCEHVFREWLVSATLEHGVEPVIAEVERLCGELPAPWDADHWLGLSQDLAELRAEVMRRQLGAARPDDIAAGIKYRSLGTFACALANAMRVAAGEPAL